MAFNVVEIYINISTSVGVVLYRGQENTNTELLFQIQIQPIFVHKIFFTTFSYFKS